MQTQFMKWLAKRESSNNKLSINPYGFLGLYQMGKLALIDAGFIQNTKLKGNDYQNYVWVDNIFKIKSYQDFLNSEPAQNAAAMAYHKKLWSYIVNYKMDKLTGQVIDGVLITKSGLIGGAHLVGAKALSEYLIDNGEPPKDANEVSCLDYMKLLKNLDVGF